MQEARTGGPAAAVSRLTRTLRCFPRADGVTLSCNETDVAGMRDLVDWVGASGRLQGVLKRLSLSVALCRHEGSFNEYRWVLC